jgi:hypothetical protein
MPVASSMSELVQHSGYLVTPLATADCSNHSRASFSGDGPGQMWIDRSGELYVFNSFAGSISAYPDGANGAVNPDRTISTSVGKLLGSIAVHENVLFADAVNGTQTEVEAFNKNIDGVQTPLDVFSIPNMFAGITVAPWTDALR